MQPAGNNKLKIKNVCALIFCLSIIILGAICCGYDGHMTSTPPPPLLSSGQCKSNDVAPVAGEQTLAVVVQTGQNIIICILRASDGLLLRHYDLALYGIILGSGDGLLYINEYSNSSVLCAIQISDGLERWCQPQQNTFNFSIAGNGNVYTTSYSTNDQILITAFSEHDGRVLWTAPTSYATSATSKNQLLLTTSPGVVYSYRTIAAASPTPTTSTNQTFASGVNGVCALRASDGRQLWCSPLANQSVTGMVVNENSLYVRNIGDYPSISAIDTASGIIRWTTPIKIYPTASSLLTVTNGIVFTNIAGSDTTSDQLYAIRASDGKQLWNVSQLGWITSVTATDKNVYAVENSGTLHVLNILNGKATWSYSPSLEDTQEPYNNNYSNNNNGNTIFVEHNVAFILINTNRYAHLIARNANDGATLWQDQECNSSIVTPTVSPNTASSQGIRDRCYWASDENPEGLKFSLYEIDN